MRHHYYKSSSKFIQDIITECNHQKAQFLLSSIFKEHPYPAFSILRNQFDEVINYSGTNISNFFIEYRKKTKKLIITL